MSPGPADAGAISDGGGKEPSFIERARRAQIVDAAIGTLVEVGYAKTSFARIAKRAGISPGLISYHFGSKEQLLVQVVTEIERSLDEAITAAAQDAETFTAGLRALIESLVRHFGAHPDRIVAMGEIFGHAGQDGPIAEWAQTSRAQTLRDLQAMLEEGQQEGEFRPLAPRTVAISLLAALEAVPQELLERPDTDVEAYARELADLFVAAVAAPRRSRRR